MIILYEKSNTKLSRIFQNHNINDIESYDDGDYDNKTDISILNKAFKILKNILKDYKVIKYTDDQPYRICIYRKNDTKNNLFFIRNISSQEFKIIVNNDYENAINNSIDAYKKDKNFSCSVTENTTYDKACFSFSNVEITEKSDDENDENVFVGIINIFISKTDK